MPLTEVYTQDSSGAWVRTTAAAMDREYNYKVSASSHIFRCNKCLQYVIFVKGNNYRISHFKHNAKEEDKDCEDRTFGTGGYSYGSFGILDVPDPMRLQFDGARAYLEIGFFPVPAITIDNAMKQGTTIRICGVDGLSDSYRVDWTRFEPHSMTWLRLPFDWAEDYSVNIVPENPLLKLWNIQRTALSQRGTVFDAKTGRRIPFKGDICVGKDYFVLCHRKFDLYCGRFIEFGRRIVINDNWCLYRMYIPTLNKEAADYCVEQFKLFLTAKPSEIELLWPPALESDELIDTNQKKLYMHIKGESDFEAYPNYAARNTNIVELDNNEKIVELNIINTLQMVSATRFNQRLKFLYVRPWVPEKEIIEPDLRVLDDQNKEVTDELKSAPVRGILRIHSDVDTTVDVEDMDGFLYRLDIPAQKETRLQDLKRGMLIVIRQGMKIVRQIVISERHSERKRSIAFDDFVWEGRMVPMPQRYAWILGKLDRNSELYRRTAQALKDGMIPMGGLKALIEIAGGR